MEKHKAVKIEITFDDGCVQTLDGESAQQYMKNVNSASVMAYVHGYGYTALPWVEIKSDNHKE